METGLHDLEESVNLCVTAILLHSLVELLCIPAVVFHMQRVQFQPLLGRKQGNLPQDAGIHTLLIDQTLGVQSCDDLRDRTLGPVGELR